MSRGHGLRRFLLLLLLSYGLTCPTHVDAVFGVGDIVFDPTVWGEAFTTAINTTQQLANQLKDLASLTNLGLVVNIAASTRRVMVDVQGIAEQLRIRSGQWEHQMDFSRFTSADPQDLAELLGSWNQESAGLMADCAREAMQAQRLLDAIVPTLQDVSTLVSGIASVTGSVAGLQSLAGMMAAATAQAISLQSLTGSFHQAMLSKDFLLSTHERVSRLIAQEQLRDYGMGIE